MVFIVILAPFFLLAMVIAMVLTGGPPLVMLARWAWKNPIKGLLAAIPLAGALFLAAAVVMAGAAPGKEHIALFLFVLYIPAILSGLLAWVLLFRKEYGKAFVMWLMSACYGGLISPWFGLVMP